ncbi:hypothetical protein HPB52_009250 [Rhipicephalus sanguineus]|uniref:DDE Tnp4 domain-containing protein n=1 Tax=Rhipicephalus sanguineus TaxID=34632 RepID=A0A9D4SR65_RHISA|nr:hypothetical protein HPB52_009250 [Rhipicephalus sanguineus]
MLSLPTERRWWVRPLWMNREVESEFYTSMPLLMAGDREYFKKYYRMTPEKFEELHSLVEEPLTLMLVTREPVPSKARLAITIRYLASGMYIQDVAMAFKVGISTAAGIIHFTCRLLWSVLQPRCLKIPTAARWQEIANDFRDKWNFPLCVGAVDGKHVQIQMPPHTGSLYYNYKGTYSIVLMAVVDSNLKFVAIDVGAYGRQSDGGTFSNSRFGQALENGLLCLPPPQRLPNDTTIAPHVFEVRGKRFRCHGLEVQNIRRTINLLPENADYVVMASCVLHNFLSEDTFYMPSNYADREDQHGNTMDGQWRSAADAEGNAMLQLQPPLGHNYRRSAAETRDLFRSYFVSSQGAVPWQRASAGLRP